MAREVFKSKVFPGVEIELMDDFGVEDAEEMAADENNVRNRPKKAGAVKRYASVVLKKNWDLNGETLIRDEKNRTISGRNRSLGVLLAEKKRLADPEHYKQYGLRGPVKIPVIRISGIKSKCFRSVDSGEKRSGGDLFYCEKVFDHYKMADEKESEFKDSQKKKLARILATAARTVWLRLEGKDVSDAPGFPTTAQEEFVKKHPILIDCVAHVYRCDDGAGNERAIQSLVSPAYMAAVMYLGGVMKTDRDAYNESGSEAIDDSLMKDAEEFVDSFATGANLGVGHPILTLKKLYNAQKTAAAKGEGTRDRDVVLNMLVKAMVLFLDGEKVVTPADIKWNPEKDAVPRVGGLDETIEVEPEAALEGDDTGEEGEAEEAPPKKPTKKAAKKKKAKKPAKKAPKADEVDETDEEPEEDEESSED